MPTFACRYLQGFMAVANTFRSSKVIVGKFC